MNNSNNNKLNHKLQIMKYLHYLITIGLFICCWFSFYSSLANGEYHPKADVLICVIYSFVAFCMLRSYNSYDIAYDLIPSLIYSQSISDFICMFAGYLCACLNWQHLVNPIPILFVFVLQLCVNILWTFVANTMYFSNKNKAKAVVIYQKKVNLIRLNETKYFKHRFDVIYSYEAPSEADLDNIYEKISESDVVFVIGVPATLRNSIVKYCVEKDIQSYVAPHVGDIIMAGGSQVSNLDLPIWLVERKKLPLEYQIVKRSFDIIVSLLFSLILLPLMLVVAAIIKFQDGGPIFYKQTRYTLNAKTFEVYKFRSMRVDAEKDGVARISTKHDDRITPFGHFIRAVRIDELPQLFNILKGDMSFVGPRPERPEIAEEYEKDIPAFKLRLQVKAGLTGYAQVYGKYNTNPYDKLEMDLMYINSMNVITDLRLIFATIKILTKKESTEGIEDTQLNALVDEVN